MAERRVHTAVGTLALAGVLLAVFAPVVSAQRRPTPNRPARDNSGLGAVRPLADGGPRETDGGVGAADAGPVDRDAAESDEAAEMESRRSRAAAEFGLGMDDYRRGDFASAAAHFQSAYDALPDPAPLFNMARSWEGANEIARALLAYERYLAASPAAGDRDEVLARLALLRQRPVELFVTSQPPGAFVFLDGSAEPMPGTTPLVVRLPPGPHTVGLVREGYARAEREVVLRAGERQTFSTPLRPDEPGGGVTGASRLDPVILDRRIAVPWATRTAFGLALARAYDGQPFGLALGGDFTLMYRRNFAANARFIRLEPDGMWTLGSVGAGYVLPIEDIDVSVLGHLGAAYGFVEPNGPALGHSRRWSALGGAELRTDWYFHRRLSLGGWIRGDVLMDFSSNPRVLTTVGLLLGLTP
jgi:hypothetical protein